jgi:hypothetical protein
MVNKGYTQDLQTASFWSILAFNKLIQAFKT